MPIATHEIVLDMQVALRKPHACGATTWQVVRVGVDIGLRCLQCQHRVTLPRDQFVRQVRRIVSLPQPPESKE
jgi:hypothetical protein